MPPTPTVSHSQLVTEQAHYIDTDQTHDVGSHISQAANEDNTSDDDDGDEDDNESDDEEMIESPVYCAWPKLRTTGRNVTLLCCRVPLSSRPSGRI